MEARLHEQIAEKYQDAVAGRRDVEILQPVVPRSLSQIGNAARSVTMSNISYCTISKEMDAFKREARCCLSLTGENGSAVHSSPLLLSQRNMIVSLSFDRSSLLRV